MGVVGLVCWVIGLVIVGGIVECRADCGVVGLEGVIGYGLVDCREVVREQDVMVRDHKGIIGRL